MAPVWSDQFLSGQKSGQIPDRIKVTQISNPSFTGGAAYIGVTKASKNPDLAMKFADFILDARGAGQDRRADRGIPGDQHRQPARRR